MDNFMMVLAFLWNVVFQVATFALGLPFVVIGWVCRSFWEGYFIGWDMLDNSLEDLQSDDEYFNGSFLKNR